MRLLVTGGAGYIGPGDPPTLIAGSRKIERELGWQPQFQGLPAIVRQPGLGSYPTAGYRS